MSESNLNFEETIEAIVLDLPVFFGRVMECGDDLELQELLMETVGASKRAALEVASIPLEFLSSEGLGFLVQNGQNWKLARSIDNEPNNRNILIDGSNGQIL